MKKKIIIVCGILLAIICIAISFFIWINKDKTDYDKIYLNSLNFEGRLAEYTFKPKVNNDSGYKIKFKIKEELKEVYNSKRWKYTEKLSNFFHKKLK